MIKKIIFAILFCLIIAKVDAQKSKFIFFSDENNSSFRVYLNGQKQNNFFQRRIEIDSLTPKKYKVRIVFQQDSIADIDEVIKLDAGIDKTIAIVEKSKLSRKVGKIERKINRSLFKDGSLGDEKKLKDFFSIQIISETKIEEK